MIFESGCCETQPVDVGLAKGGREREEGYDYTRVGDTGAMPCTHLDFLVPLSEGNFRPDFVDGENQHWNRLISLSAITGSVKHSNTDLQA